MAAPVLAIAPPVIRKIPALKTAPPKTDSLILLLFWSAVPSPTIRTPLAVTPISGDCASTAGAVVLGLPVLSAALWPSIVTPETTNPPSVTVKSMPVWLRFAFSLVKPVEGGFVGTE